MPRAAADANGQVFGEWGLGLRPRGARRRSQGPEITASGVGLKVDGSEVQGSGLKARGAGV